MLRLAVGFVCLVSGAAAAQSLAVDSFRPAIDSRGYLTLNGSQPLGDRDVSFGMGALDWAHGTLPQVDNAISSTLIAAFGLELGPVGLELGASAPFRIVSGDSGAQGIGNVGFHLKTRLARGRTWGVGLLGSVYLPSASPDDKFMGEPSTSGQIIGIADKDFVDHRLRFAVNGGLRLRSTTPGATMTAGNEIPFGGAIAWAVSPQKFDVVGEVFGTVPLGTHVGYQPLEAIAGVKLYLARNSFLSLGAGRGLRADNPDFRAFIGIVFEPNIGDRDGDGIKDDVDKCPDDPEDFDGFEDEDGCPDPDNDRDGIRDEDDKCPNIPGPPPDGCPITEKGDRDGDGIPDSVDKCPDDPEDFDGFQDEDGCPDLDNDQDGILDVDDLCPNDPEDKDGFEDEDGCPDPDNDRDGILDKDDKCPNEPETKNGFEDEDGCPDHNGITELGDGTIDILKPINFELDKATIKKESYYILDAVVKTMQGNPVIALIEIQGHTDEQGDDAYNLDLSDRRAKSVMTYLTDHGVDPKRLTAQGYGETQPIDRRHTQEAYARNRRVQFIILKRTDQ